MGILDYIERVKRENEGPRITAQEPRIELAGGGALWKLLYKGKSGLQHGAHYNRLMKQYKSQGMDLLKAGDKAMAEAIEITRNKKIKIVQDQMNKTNIHKDDYVDLIDEYYRLTDYEMYKDIKRWDKTRPSLADKTRAIVFPDWAEARYGEDYHTVLERGQTREIQQSIDPNIKEPLSPADQMASDIDDMNKANLDELLGGRKKNAYGGRIGLSDGLSADYPLGDLHKRMQEAKRAWRTYKGSRHRSSRKLSYPQFFKLWAAENMAEGGRIGLKPGGIVEPGVVNYGKKDKMTIADLKEAGIKSKARYYIPSKDKYALSTKVLDENARWTGKFKTELFDSVKDRETFAKNRLEKQKLTVKKLQEESIKAQAKIDKQVNNWTKNWFEKNTKTFKVGNYDDTIAKFAKAWAIESKKAVYQAPSIWKRALTTENGLPILRDAKIFGMDSPDMVKRGQSVAGAQERILDSAQAYYKRVFHSGLLKNSTLRNNVKDFMIWAAKDKTGAGWRGLLAKASDWLTEDTIKLMGEIDMSVLPAKSRAEILRYHFPKTADNYLKKVNMVENIRKETEKAVEKLAGKEPGYIRKMLEADRRKLRKIFNTDKLPLVFKYSGDHMLGLREAQLLGDEKFAKKAVENLIGRTFAQNSELGGLSFGNQRRGLTKEFANPKTTSARKAKIVERLNILAEEFIPGEVKYSLGTKNNLIAKPLKIQTQPERFASYFQEIAKTTEGTAAIKKQYGSLDNLLKTLKTAKGPAKFKAMQAVITTVGTAAAASLFDKFGIQSAMADTGAAAPGVTAGDIALAGTAPLATKKGRSLYGKALSGASKILSTTPGFLGLEAFIGPGFVSSAGGSFSEAIASPLLLEGTMRNRRIYNKLKEQGLSTENIETVKDSLMLDADPFMSSMMPTSKSATNPKIRAAASQAYDWASAEIAKEDEARLERADKFDYLQDTGFATGGLANLTRTVAPDSGPMQGLASTPEYDTYRKEYKWQT